MGNWNLRQFLVGTIHCGESKGKLTHMAGQADLWKDIFQELVFSVSLVKMVGLDSTAKASVHKSISGDFN